MAKYGIRIRKEKTDPWQRGQQFRRAQTPSGWTYWRNEWPNKKAAQLRLAVYRTQGWKGHVFEIKEEKPKPKVYFIPYEKWGRYNRVNAGNTPWIKETETVIHYGAIGNPIEKTYEAALRMVRAHEAGHIAKGWRGYSYHASIFEIENGDIVVFLGSRYPQTWGAHTGAANANTKPGIMFGLGDTEQPVAMMDEAYRQVRRRFGVQGGRTRGHKDFMATSCPGKPLYKRYVEGWRNFIER